MSKPVSTHEYEEMRTRIAESCLKLSPIFSMLHVVDRDDLIRAVRIGIAEAWIEGMKDTVARQSALLTRNEV